MVKVMLDFSMIRENNNPYASLVGLVKKNDETWKMCIIYRALNRATIKDKYLISLIEELLNELGRAVIFFKN